MMKGCDLCRGIARVYCESDEAILCFDCDARVHGANFLVARHSRVLLCRSCQSPTPWKASGPSLGPTVSVCDGCFAGRSKKMKSRGDDDDGDEGESREREMGKEEDDGGDDGDDDDDMAEDEESDDDDDDDDDEGEEQVVPGTAEEEDAPTVASSSSSEEGESMLGRSGNRYLKRTRHNVADLASSASLQDYPLPRTVVDDEAITESFRPLKDQKRADLFRFNSHQLPVDMVSFGSGHPPI